MMLGWHISAIPGIEPGSAACETVTLPLCYPDFCVRMRGSVARSRLAYPGPQWAVDPRNYYDI